MLMVARWSAIEVWYTWFSCFRFSPACFKLTIMSCSSALSASISRFNASMVLTKLVCFSSKSSFVLVSTLIESSVWSISFLQNSCFSYSSFCCFANSACILSMASFTFVKASKRARTASDTNAQFLCFRATFAIRNMAFSAARSWAAIRLAETPSCKKFKDLLNKSRASSSARIFKVSLMATISWLRISERFLYSCFSCSQSLRMLSRNSSSATIAASVASRSFLD
mmetsp:Transcript_92133/g.265851  ORF Transcript_92133/g.265851 Transcript_92133/m.265851 type:complete len:226 (+) Transcript_92133:587-1264(+)